MQRPRNASLLDTWTSRRVISAITLAPNKVRNSHTSLTSQQLAVSHIQNTQIKVDQDQCHKINGMMRIVGTYIDNLQYRNSMVVLPPYKLTKKCAR